MPRRGQENNFMGQFRAQLEKRKLSNRNLQKRRRTSYRRYFSFRILEFPSSGSFPKRIIKQFLESEEVILQPIISGINQTFFDLLMPFVFWDGEYLHSGKVAGRPSHLFNFRSPEWIRKSKPDWDKVVLAIDDAYYAPLRAEIFTKSSRLLRSNTLRSYKKVGEQWIVKSLDCTNQTDRSNTRLEIIGAATQLDLSPRFFGENSFQHPLLFRFGLYNFLTIFGNESSDCT